MQEPDAHPEESRRLASLRALELLDTRPEERFDRITRMACRLFDVPISLVTLLDEDRQWFKSRQGMNREQGPRAESFCGHAVLGSGVFVVEDAAADPRFADNPMVTGRPGIGFYAGVPLRTPDGMPVGTLCIIDRNPRELGGEDEKTLVDLAAMVERELAVTELATTDDLTGVSNRRGFLARAQRNLRMCRKHSMRATLVFLDLDRFKEINDRFGHEAGDRALVDFVRLMRRTLRNSDLFGRLGGDEFVALLVESGRERAEEVIRRFAGEVEAFNAGGRREYALHFSHGAVEYDPGRHESIEDLLAEGDELMFRHKRRDDRK